jgi:hypothetical protein
MSPSKHLGRRGSIVWVIEVGRAHGPTVMDLLLDTIEAAMIAANATPQLHPVNPLAQCR